MGIVERREREKQELRKKILDAARELFVEQGYEAVTMRKIADAIEYSPTALYCHFADKDSLIRDLCAEDFQALAKSLQQIAREPDPLVRLQRAGLAYVRFGIEHANHYRLMFMTAHPAAKSGEEMQAYGKGNPEQDAYEFLYQTVSEAIAKGMLRPGMTDAHMVAQAAWAGVHGIVSLHIAKGSDPWITWSSLEETAQLLTSSLVRGLSRKET